jgi:hypothetical protein
MLQFNKITRIAYLIQQDNKNCISHDNRIIIMTNGMIIRKMQDFFHPNKDRTLLMYLCHQSYRIKDNNLGDNRYDDHVLAHPNDANMSAK